MAHKHQRRDRDQSQSKNDTARVAIAVVLALGLLAGIILSFFGYVIVGMTGDSVGWLVSATGVGLIVMCIRTAIVLNRRL